MAWFLRWFGFGAPPQPAIDAAGAAAAHHPYTALTPVDVLLFDDVMTRLAGRRPYRVLITGLLHAGKSTLVNSLLRIQNNDWRDEMPTPCLAGTGGIAGRAGPAGDGVAAQDDMSMTTRLTKLSARRGTCAVDLIDSPHVWHGADDELMFRIVNGLPYNTELLEGACRVGVAVVWVAFRTQ